MKKGHLTIAIDGPASSGKSTVAKQLAKNLGLIYIDTGAMYRSLTLKALEYNINVNDENELSRLLDEISINFTLENETQEVWLDEENVTDEIRTDRVTNSVSIVSAHENIRLEMVKRQREMAANKNIIMDGRDIGTVVLPEATIKIFLMASVEERAKRRYEENIEKGYDSNYEILIEEIKHRDSVDSNREVSPLRKAEDAFLVDSTQLIIEEVVGRIEEIIIKHNNSSINN